jgi:hypothetical protein
MAVPTRTNIYPIYSPAHGLVLNTPSTFLDPRATPDCQNVRFYDQIVEKRTGYPSTAYAGGTITGVPIKLYTYTKAGVDHEMLATTSNLLYRYYDDWTSIKGSMTNNVTNRVSMCTMFNTNTFNLYFGSHNTGMQVWNGTDAIAAITADVVYKPKVILPYQFRMLLFNIDEAGTDFPIKFRYTVPNPTNIATDWTATGSGSRNMIQGAGSEIVNAVAIKDYVGVYKDKSISVLDYVGGSSIFATAVHIEGIGLLAQDAIVNLGTSHLFIGSDYNIYEWNGGWELIPIGNAVKDYIKSNIYKTNKSRCFAIPNYENTEAHFFIPIGTDDYPTRFLTYNWTDKTWALNTCASCSGGGNLNIDGVEKTMIGLSAGTVHNYDYSSTNDGSTAINSYFTTPDVTIDKEEYKIKMKGYKNVYVDAKGNTLGMQYSTDEGDSYTDIDTDTLDSTSIYNLHAFNYAQAARNIRFKFANSTADESYAARFVGIEHKDIKQSGRK